MGLFKDYLNEVKQETDESSATDDILFSDKKPGTKGHHNKPKQFNKKDIPENADFDSKEPELHSYGNNYDAMSLQGRASTKQKKRATNARYGDNPLDKDQEPLEEADHQTMLDQLQGILNDAGIDNDEIKNGVPISLKGKQQIAARLGTSASEIDTLMSSLRSHLSHDEKNRMIQEIDVDPYNEEDIVPGKIFNKGSGAQHGWQKYGEQSDVRFSFEPDSLGNLTITDSETGESKFLQGSEASTLADELENNEDSDFQQHVLELAFLKESSIYNGFFLTEELDGFEEEIDSDSGTYNMPWKLDDEHGNMTVFFTDEKGKPELKIQSVRDEDGNELHDMDEDLLLVQAKAFLGKE